MPLSDVTATSVEPKDSLVRNLFSGGIRDRLRVEAGAAVHLFVVSRPEEAAEQIRSAMSL